MRAAVVCFVVLALVAGPVSAAGAQVDTSDLPPSYAEEIREAQARVDAATAEFADAETRRYEMEAQIERLQARLVDAEAALVGLRDRLRDMAVNEYVRAGSGTPTVFDEDINRQVRANALAEIVTESDTDALDAYRAATADLEQDREELDRLLAEQRELVADLESAQAEMVGELERLQELEAERQAEIQRREEEERRRQEEERRRQEEERERREREAAANRPANPPTTRPPSSNDPSPAPPPSSPPPSSGGWVCPVAGPHSFIDSWGAPRSGGRSHKGVDMMASTGTPVVAPVSGTVTHRGNSIGGLSFHLNGVDGHYYYGTHLSAYGASGQVQAGTVIGYVGDTGNARGIPHLHFEIHPNGGSAVNPTPTVRAACG
ncbi:murein hydrolase activator EnvC family protein [Actinomarinicola tropica]|uniref:Peptidoglycan DD-metalloendopeptidase family protein n=1 Tax=Actinomarinicola tropica TaxID=2789776 RepID=A0A5Q2RE01_9ACTN|nr:M23 family metallopeptidase [Actinomarinicola tropica]QGG95128.1 peptidoglycan DD-metalloendopeptidase family protein [Actinomarinicola tropica]